MSKSTPNPNQLPLFDPFTLEIWKPIPGYGARYEVSSAGRVRRVKENMGNGAWREPYLKHRRDTAGYVQVGLWDGKRKFIVLLHKLVADAFLGERPNGLEVNHIDLDKTNNHVTNLEYVTRAENLRHARQHKSWGVSGEKAGQSKLTNAQAAEIRLSKLSERQLARIYGVSQVAIHYIRVGKTYRKAQEE